MRLATVVVTLLPILGSGCVVIEDLESTSAEIPESRLPKTGIVRIENTLDPDLLEYRSATVTLTISTPNRGSMMKSLLAPREVWTREFPIDRPGNYSVEIRAEGRGWGSSVGSTFGATKCLEDEVVRFTATVEARASVFESSGSLKYGSSCG